MIRTRTAVMAALIAFGALSSHAAVVETAHLVVTGGPNAGTYESSTEKGGCTYGFAGPGSWGNQLSSPRDKDPKHFNSLQLIVPDAKKAASGAKEFFVMVGFGPIFHRGTEYQVETRNGKNKSGSGTVSVADHGSTAVVKFDVMAFGNVRLAGTIDCKSVMRAGK